MEGRVGNSASSKPIGLDRTENAPIDLHNEEDGLEPDQLSEEHPLASRRTKRSTSTKRESRKIFSNFLRFNRNATEGEPSKARGAQSISVPRKAVTAPRGATQLWKPQIVNSRKRSTRKNSGPSRDGQRYSRDIPRSSSHHDSFPHEHSQRRTSLSRSSSEHQRGVDSLRTSHESPRSSSRRWQGDDFTVQRAAQAEEGELESFFRFVEDCTNAVWVFLKRIPVVISQFPEITMSLLKRVIPALRGPATPLIEGPRD